MACLDECVTVPDHQLLYKIWTWVDVELCTTAWPAVWLTCHTRPMSSEHVWNLHWHSSLVFCCSPYGAMTSDLWHKARAFLIGFRHSSLVCVRACVCVNMAACPVSLSDLMADREDSQAPFRNTIEKKYPCNYIANKASLWKGNTKEYQWQIRQSEKTQGGGLAE